MTQRPKLDLHRECLYFFQDKLVFVLPNEHEIIVGWQHPKASVGIVLHAVQTQINSSLSTVYDLKGNEFEGWKWTYSF